MGEGGPNRIHKGFYHKWDVGHLELILCQHQIYLHVKYQKQVGYGQTTFLVEEGGNSVIVGFHQGTFIVNANGVKVKKSFRVHHML